MTLAEVRRWARGRRFVARQIRRSHDAALLHVASRLLQAIHRESRVTRLARDSRGRWHLEVGRKPVLRAPASGPLPFRRIEITGRPPGIRTVPAFLRSLERCLKRSEYARVFAALRSDFENSVANVLLNRLIGSRLGRKARALEPAYQGHQYYPFPALRIGPSLSQVLECSHLCEEPVDLPLLDIGSHRVISAAFDDADALFRAWSGLRGATLLPVHPWQLRLSPVVRELSASRTVKAIPLASQRTCRIVRTGYDVKLPVDATLTGEHRLLFRLNCVNAPLVSALARHARREGGVERLDFQPDIASIFHPAPGLAPHLSAIVRSPVRARAGERIVPAINLWAGRHEARALLRDTDLQEFFARYCRALMSGPVEFYAQWGMAFEPHLQNVYVGLREDLPSRILLRDLDNSILEPRRVRALLRELDARPAPGTWRHMPSFELGGKRLVQAMLFGHLGEVIACLSRYRGVSSGKLAAIVDDTWSELAARAPSSSARKAVHALRGWSDAVKATLRTRLERAATMEFVRE